MIDRNFAVETDSGYATCSMAADGVGVAFVDDLSVPANSASAVNSISSLAMHRATTASANAAARVGAWTARPRSHEGHPQPDVVRARDGLSPTHGAEQWACDSRAVKARPAGLWRRPSPTAVVRVPAEPAERRPPVARRKESQHPAGPMVCRAARRRPPSMAATATIPQSSMPARVTMGPLTCLPMKPAPIPRSSGRSAMGPFGVPSRGLPCVCGRTAVQPAVSSA